MLRIGLVFTPRVNALAITSFAFSLAVTVGSTFGISFRLWRAGRTTSEFTGDNAYKAAMYSIIESGALYTCCNVVLISLLLAHNFIGDVTIDIDMQIAVGISKLCMFLFLTLIFFQTLSPLLLIARLGYAETTPETTSQTDLTFANPIRVNITEDICTHPPDAAHPSSRSIRKSIQSYPDSGEQDTV